MKIANPIFKIISAVVLFVFTTTTISWSAPDLCLRQLSASERGIGSPARPLPPRWTFKEVRNLFSNAFWDAQELVNGRHNSKAAVLLVTPLIITGVATLLTVGIWFIALVFNKYYNVPGAEYWWVPLPTIIVLGIIVFLIPIFLMPYTLVKEIQSRNRPVPVRSTYVPLPAPVRPPRPVARPAPMMGISPFYDMRSVPGMSLANVTCYEQSASSTGRAVVFTRTAPVKMTHWVDPQAAAYDYMTHAVYRKLAEQTGREYKPRPGRALPGIILDGNARGYVLLCSSFNSNWTAPNQFLIIDGKLVRKPDGARGIFQPVYEPLNGYYTVFSLDQGRMLKVHIDNNNFDNPGGVQEAMSVIPILKDGQPVQVRPRSPGQPARADEWAIFDAQKAVDEVAASFSLVGTRDEDGATVFLHMSGSITIEALRDVAISLLGLKDAGLLSGSADVQQYVRNPKGSLPSEYAKNVVGRSRPRPWVDSHQEDNTRRNLGAAVRITVDATKLRTAPMAVSGGATDEARTATLPQTNI